MTILRWLAAFVVTTLLAVGGAATAGPAEDAFVEAMIKDSGNCHAIYRMAQEQRPDMAESAATMEQTARGVYRVYTGMSDEEIAPYLDEIEAIWHKYIGRGDYSLDDMISSCDHHFRIKVAQHNKAVGMGIQPTADLDVPEMHETEQTQSGGYSPQCQAIADDFEMRATEMNYTLRDAADDPQGEKAEYFRKYGADYLHDKFEYHLNDARNYDCPSELIEALQVAIEILEPLAD